MEGGEDTQHPIMAGTVREESPPVPHMLSIEPPTTDHWWYVIDKFSSQMEAQQSSDVTRCQPTLF